MLDFKQPVLGFFWDGVFLACMIRYDMFLDVSRVESHSSEQTNRGKIQSLQEWLPGKKLTEPGAAKDQAQQVARNSR